MDGVIAQDGNMVGLKFPQAIRTTIHVDSRDRDFTVHPSSSQFTIDLPETLRNVTSARMVTAELPLTYYVFSTARGNRSLTVSVNGSPQTVTIPEGNYTPTQMAAALKSALDTAFGATFTVTIDPVTMKTTIATTGTVAVDASSATKPTEWGLGYYLGFPGGVVTSGTNSVTGTRVANLSPENYLVLDIEELNALSQCAMYDAGGSGKKSFAKIPLKGNSYSYNFYDTPVADVLQRPQLSKLDRLRVSVRYHDGTLVDLNGCEWSCSIEFACTLARAP